MMIFGSRAAFRFPPVTTCLLILQLSLWLIHPLLFAGVGCNQCLAHGEWWRLATSLFIHYSFSHLVGNSLCLFAIGSFLEIRLTKIRFLLLFFAAGIAGNILTFLVMPVNFVHTGASGAIFGLLGAQLYMFYTERHRYSREQILLVFALALLVTATFFGPNTNIIAHLGGLLAGGLFTPFLYKK
ncbi:rhomboid family intramembrane serine protease [Ectobacillus panaciterrae]|uniref:rhomboid family intramembrane serine protease n=1 Tax=Ectobacillus panaciterrae TaxID=363872 RepID=UPI0004194208|nr:rhomboid family intramembrane serine protease [Ectobacillus panaciterrae]